MKKKSTKSLMLTIFTLVHFIINPVLFAQNSIFVDSKNTTVPSNGTKENPYQSIQQGLDAASDGDTVKVVSGTYAENLVIQGKTIVLYGAYNDDFTERDFVANLTILQGDATESVVTLNEAGSSIVNGFNVTGGTRSSLEVYYDNGGGFYCYGGSPTISNNIIEKNDAHPPTESGNEVGGGGIYSIDADINILNNIIRNNQAGRGAGINVNGGNVTIRGNKISGNIADSDHGGGLYIGAPNAEISENDIIENEVGRDIGYGWGGGIVILNEGSHAVISNNRIIANSAPTEGSGVFIDDGAGALIQNNLIANNACTQDGGVAIYVDGAGEGNPGDLGSTATIINCTVVGNFCTTAVAGGNGIEVERNSQVIVENSIFWGNGGDDFFVDGSSKLTVTFCNSEESIQGEGNFQGDPLFANEDSDDFHLQSTGGRWDPLANAGNGAFVADAADSPCLDAGNPATEFANESSPNGGRVNLGWYGNTAEASKSANISSVEQITSLPEIFALHQNFPNPFNPTTTIAYDLPKAENVVLKIYNVLGHEVRTLLNTRQQPGVKSVDWDGKNELGLKVSSGVFIYRLQAGSAVQSKKMIMLK